MNRSCCPATGRKRRSASSAPRTLSWWRSSMSEKIGNTVPPPLRFEMGAEAAPGEPARAYLLVTAGDDVAPRVAVLARTEVAARDERRVTVSVRAGTTTEKNLRRGAMAVV